MGHSLAEAARAAPCSAVQPAQVRTIMRELLDALALLHGNGVVVLDLSPTTVRVNLALRSRADVAIALSRPVLAGVPMAGALMARLLDLPTYGHRYLAPEIAAQLVASNTSRALSVSDPADFAIPDAATVTATTAADMWSLGCVMAELVLGRPVFPSDAIGDHASVVSYVLGVPVPQRAPAGAGVTGGGPPPATTASRLGVFTGIGVPSSLASALAHTDTSFRQLVAALLSVDPALRPTAEDVVRSPFIAMGLVGTSVGARARSVGGASGGVGSAAGSAGKPGGGMGAGAGAQPARHPAVGDGSHAAAAAAVPSSPKQGSRGGAAGGGSSGGGGSISHGQTACVLEFGTAWALPYSANRTESLAALLDASPLMP